ncbi:MAG TPA: YceI family protein [Alphaproteobacteria bacterium]
MKSLSRFLLLSLALAGFSITSAQAAETYAFDPHHTMVNWQAGHFGFSHPTGKFPLVNGTLILDEKTPANSKVDVVIDATKISTGDEKFDEHLKSKDFFDVAKYGSAKFVSTKVEVTGKDTAKVTGNLTLLDKTKQVVLDVKLNQIGEHPFTKKKSVGFSATTTIKRSEFGIAYGIPAVPDDVALTIEAEASVADATPAK